MGVNTIAYIILCTNQGIKFDFILFSDPGSENPKTYEYIEYFNKWLKEHKQPKIITLNKRDKNKEILTLYDDNFRLKTLPSIAYGFKKCSLKYKVGPFDVFLNNSIIAQKCIKNGFHINTFIGIDMEEDHRAVENPNQKYRNIYPLISAEFGRFECAQYILSNGLILPPKSSCTYCPSMKPWEIIALYETYPSEFYRAIRLEQNAMPNLTSIKGLGRDFAWWDIILAYKYLKLIRKYSKIGFIPQKIEKLMIKINRSKPLDYEKLSKQRSAKKCIGSLFSQNINTPCECQS